MGVILQGAVMTKNGVSLSWGGLDRALGKAVHRMGDTQDLMDSIGEALVSSTLKRFQDEKSPEGEKWEPSARAAASGGTTLSNTGDLKKSIDKYVTSNKVMVGSNKEYARIHQLGGTVRPKKGKYLKFKGLGGEDVFAREVTIPARPYLGISDDDREEIVATMTDFLEGAFK